MPVLSEKLNQTSGLTPTTENNEHYSGQCSSQNFLYLTLAQCRLAGIGLNSTYSAGDPHKKSTQTCKKAQEILPFFNATKWRKRLRLPHVLRRLLLSPFSSSAPTPTTSSTDAAHESSDPKGEMLAFSGLFSSCPASRESLHLNFILPSLRSFRFLAFPYFLFCLSLGSVRRRFELKTCCFATDFAGGLKFSQNEHLFRCELRHSFATRAGIVTVPTFVMMATYIIPTLSQQSITPFTQT